MEDRRIVILGIDSGLTGSLNRLARQLKLQLMFEAVAEAELERMRAESSEQRVLHVDDIPVMRSRDWDGLDTVHLTPYCAYYEAGNPDLVRARRDCPHGLRVRERARRIHEVIAPRERFRGTTCERQERLRPRAGGTVV